MHEPLTFEEIVQVVEQLEPELQDLLILHLHNLRHAEASPQAISREALLNELLSARHSVGSASMSSLFGRFKGPGPVESSLSETELHAALKEIATAWERELDQFATDGN